MRCALTRVLAALLIGALLSGCSTPALIADQTDQGRRELAAVIAQALGRQSILLSDDALSAAPILVIDRAAAHDARGLPLQGRERSKPAVFRLYLRAGHCLLVRQDTNGRWPLPTNRCVALAK